MTTKHRANDADRAEAVRQWAREAYEWEAMAHPCDMPFDRLAGEMAGPLTALENWNAHVRITLAQEPLTLKGAEYDLYLDTWAECLAFHAETEAK